MRVIVVGGGIWGLSTAWALHRNGMDVVLLERGPLPNPVQASFDSHRLIRFAYGAEQGYCRLVEWAFAAWETMWDDLGQSFYVETGSLALSHADGDWTAQSRQTFEALDIAHEILDAAEIRHRFPVLTAATATFGLYSERGGVLLADRIAKRLVAYLAGQGVILRGHTEIAEIDPVSATVFTSDGRSEEADMVVVACGAWTGGLLPEIAKRQWTKRQVVAYMSPPSNLVAAWSRMPILLHIGPADSYCAPPVAGTGLKFGATAYGRPDDPRRPWTLEAVEGYDSEGAAVFAHVAPYLAQPEDYRVADGKVCHFAVAEQERFIVEEIERTIVMTGCSGHGYKFAAMLGTAVADCLAGGRPSAQLTRWCAGLAA